MSPEDQKVFEDYFDLFRQPGWHSLVETLEESAVAMNSIREIPDAATMHRNQGKLEILEMVANWQDYISNLYDQENKEYNEDL